mmetsp:Transcript_68095/g.134360  ORF Transcript_68095/g.134360 Transcript_68095/m.134360 type:complete len:226 (-) Transcript_68095:3-680(-)
MLCEPASSARRMMAVPMFHCITELFHLLQRCKDPAGLAHQRRTVQQQPRHYLPAESNLHHIWHLWKAIVAVQLAGCVGKHREQSWWLSLVVGGSSHSDAQSVTNISTSAGLTMRSCAEVASRQLSATTVGFDWCGYVCEHKFGNRGGSWDLSQSASYVVFRRCSPWRCLKWASSHCKRCSGASLFMKDCMEALRVFQSRSGMARIPPLTVFCDSGVGSSRLRWLW